MSKLTLIRGLPGSGKSTLAKTYTNAVHCEADMFFTIDGAYFFNPAQVPAAHHWCAGRAEMAMDEGHDVVVSNTFTRLWEMDGYLRLADKYGYEVEIITATGNYGNIHDVPDDVVQSMRDRWES